MSDTFSTPRGFEGYPTRGVLTLPPVIALNARIRLQDAENELECPTTPDLLVPLVDSDGVVLLPYSADETTRDVPGVAGDLRLTERLELTDEDLSMMLRCGDKILSISLPAYATPTARGAEFMTAITATSANHNDRTPGATTALYTRADQIMQEVADISGNKFLYLFSTVNDRMVGWADTHGSRIFGWSRLHRSVHLRKLIGTKIYTPSLHDNQR